MFWGFVLRLIVGTFLAPFAFAFMLMPSVGLLSLSVRRDGSQLKLLWYPVLVLGFASQVYFWGMWASYCAALAVFRASHPDVTHAWVYYLVAFLFATAPLGYLASKEQASAESTREVRGIQRGSVLYSVATIAAFIAFSLRPDLMMVPYGWFVALTVPMEGRMTDAVEQKYFQTLDGWVARGGRVEEVQGTVVETCGKLVMVNASPGERVRLSTTDREEFHFRVDVCAKMTVNRVHPQPEFQKKELVSMLCAEGKLPLFAKLCARSGLR